MNGVDLQTYKKNDIELKGPIVWLLHKKKLINF
jgi:hypothetical protein